MDKLNTEEKNIINNHSFAQILSSQVNSSGFPELVYCPLQLIDKDKLLGHLSRNNPLMKVVKENSRVKVIFTGPHGYISPRWHREQVVPTWNYSTVSLTCQINIIEGDVEKLSSMKNISQHFDSQWNFEEFNHDGNSKMVQQMLAAITVFTLEIIDIESKFKLSQKRSIECRAAFQENLRLTGYNDLADIQLM